MSAAPQHRGAPRQQRIVSDDEIERLERLKRVRHALAHAGARQPPGPIFPETGWNAQPAAVVKTEPAPRPQRGAESRAIRLWLDDHRKEPPLSLPLFKVREVAVVLPAALRAAVEPASLLAIVALWLSGAGFHRIESGTWSPPAS
jgi:hypothetical protein